MAKRLFDTGIWEKAWFRKLSPKYKTAFYYILSECDCVGVWDADRDVAEFRIGSKINWEDFLKKINGNIVILPNEKWFVIDFCYFQYGSRLNPQSDSKLIQNVIKRLQKHGLWDEKNQNVKNISTLGSTLGVRVAPTLPLEDKEKEKEKEKQKEKEKEKEKENAKARARTGNTIPQKAQELLEYYIKLTGKTKIRVIPGEVTARLAEGHTIEEGKKVILFKFLRWWDNPDKKEWVNLTTLFRPSHFEEYLSQAEQGLEQMLLQAYKNFQKKFYDENMNKPLEVRKSLKLPTFEEFKQNYAFIEDRMNGPPW